jgi:hypothetical protein
MNSDYAITSSSGFGKYLKEIFRAGLGGRRSEAGVSQFLIKLPGRKVNTILIDVFAESDVNWDDGYAIFYCYFRR